MNDKEYISCGAYVDSCPKKAISYKMKKIIDIRMSFFCQESFGQIYPQLRKMVEKGLKEWMREVILNEI